MSPKISPMPTSDIVKDVILWRKRKVSVGVILVSTASWVMLEVYEFKLITVVAWLAMLLVFSLFLWSNLLKLCGKEPSDLSSLDIKEESAVRFGLSVHAWAEEGVNRFFTLGAESDVFTFGLTLGGLWSLSQIANHFNLLTLLYIGIMMGMSVPPIYVRYEESIKSVREKVKMKSKRYYEMFDERVVKKVKSKMETPKRELKEKKVE